MYISNKKVNIVSYTHKNNLTGNLVLVEIKKPKTSLLGKNNRNTYSISSELTGAINQIAKL